MQKLTVMLPICLMLAACGQSEAEKARNKAEMTEIKSQRMAREFVTGALKDPDSAEFRNQRDFCGEVNSKNSFGGYVGFQRFIAAGKDMVILEKDRTFSAEDFEKAWSQICH